MSKIKKIIQGGLEVVKDSAKQLADTVSPGKILEQAIGPKPQRTDEFGDYLKGLSPDMSTDELEKRKQEISAQDQQKLEDARKLLKTTTPDHMRLQQKQKPPRPYELSVQEEERKKAMAIEAQKKQQQQTLTVPQSKQSRGMLFGVKKKGSKGFEGLQKDTKVG